MFDSVGTAVTNQMRIMGQERDRGGDNGGNAFVSGDAFVDVKAFVGGVVEREELCIQFEWTWLLLPAGLALVTLVLLVGSVVKT